MTVSARPRRSALYMPGSNARALEKGKTLPADVLILDLEDAVAPEAKETARRQAVEAVNAGGYGGRELVIRVNGLGSAWGYDDLVAAAKSRADAVLLPKVESASDIRRAVAVLKEAGGREELGVWAMMETPHGVLGAADIAGADRRMACLVMGTSDLAMELMAAHTPRREPMLTALGLCLLAARANRLAILDGVHLDLDDEEGFRASCRQGRELGFDGKTLIHPKTIAAANEIFAPSADEIAWAGRVIAAHEEAVRAGKGVVVVDGRLIENLHVRQAQRTIETANMIADREAKRPG